MRHLTGTRITGAICWTVAVALMIYLHLYGPNVYVRAWFLAALAAGVTATLTARIEARERPQVPVSVSYDLGWKQGYRTAEAKYLGLVAQLQQQLHFLKGHAHGQDQPPAER